ncbi:MAG: sigma 54-interacting transcriptional regulator [Candidatus Schekmanbacteria bacterium]|nr:sigma 54-interacting transcriptional regulator [Candidatus Schekmanbacteria bacterium]
MAFLLLAGCGGERQESEASAERIADISGAWHFQLGDDAAWARPDFDDRGWRLRELPAPWEWNELRAYSGIAWYRREVQLAPEALGDRADRGDHLGLAMGKIGDAYEVFAGGLKLGGVGRLPPNAEPQWDRRAIFRLPRAAIPDDGRVLVAIRMWRWAGQRAAKSGPFEGPFSIGPIDALIWRELLSEITELLLTSLFFCTGLYQIQLYRRRRQVEDYFWFGLFAMNLAAYSFVQTQWKYRITDDFILMKELDYVFLFSMPAIVLQFLIPMLGLRISRGLRAYQMSFVLLAVIVPAWPGLHLSVAAMAAFELAVLPQIVFVPALVIREAWRGNADASTIAIGIGGVAIAVANDILRDHDVLDTPRLLSVGFGVLLVAMAVTLADRYSRVFGELDALRRNLERRVADRTRELEIANTELQRVDREKSAFFARVSHELRTPLTLLLGPLTSVLEQDGPPPGWRQALEMAIRNGRRLLRQVNLLLDFAKVEARQMSLELAAWDAAVVARQVVEEGAPAAKSCHIRMEYEGPSTLPSMVFDGDKIGQVLLNLLGNAIKFTPDGGKITLSVHVDGDDLVFSVTDTGCGIAGDEIPHLFQPFRQVSTASYARRLAAESFRTPQSGTGLGLPLAKEIVALHGGAIEVASTVGAGTTFRVSIPIRRAWVEVPGCLGTLGTPQLAMVAAEPAKSSCAADDTRRLDAGSGSQTAATILVVEDSPDMRAYLVEILRPDHVVILAEDGDEGIAKARAGDPDLIVTDVMMPKKSGFELVRELKSDAATSHVPVLVLTARAGAEGAVLGLSCGADDYLPKPFDPRELSARVRSLLRHRLLDRVLSAAALPSDSFLASVSHAARKLVASEGVFAVAFEDAGGNHGEPWQIAGAAPLGNALATAVLRRFDDLGLCDAPRVWASRELSELGAALRADTAAWPSDISSLAWVPIQAPSGLALGSSGITNPHVPEITLGGILVETRVPRKALTEADLGDLCGVARRLGCLLFLRDLMPKPDGHSLTGGITRHGLLRLLARYLAAARKHPFPVSLALFAVDRLRELNRERGFEKGDAILSEFIRVIRARFNAGEIVGHFGGATIAVLAAGVSGSEVEVKATEVVQALAATNPGTVLLTTASAAVVDVTDVEDVRPESLLAAALRTLESAKRAGGNRVERCRPEILCSPTDGDTMASSHLGWMEGRGLRTAIKMWGALAHVSSLDDLKETLVRAIEDLLNFSRGDRAALYRLVAEQPLKLVAWVDSRPDCPQPNDDRTVPDLALAAAASKQAAFWDGTVTQSREQGPDLGTCRELALPILHERSLLGVFYLATQGGRRALDLGEQGLELLEIVASQIGRAIDHAQIIESTVVARVREERRLREENVSLKRLIGSELKLIATHPSMISVFDMVRRVAHSDATVLVLGESGTGKEEICRLLHHTSDRRSGPFVVVDCGAIPETLLESELFGHESGAFTGASRRHIGRFEAAEGGTLMLDEVGELPLPLQVKLLRVLQVKTIRRVGGREDITVDFRLVGATHRDLAAMAKSGTYREDLYYRLSVIPIQVPPLRERGDDVLLLARHFAQRFASEARREVPTFDAGLVRAMTLYPWPGNIRELQNRIQRAVLLGEGPELRAADLELDLAKITVRPAAPPPAATFEPAANGMGVASSGAPGLPPTTAWRTPPGGRTASNTGEAVAVAAAPQAHPDPARIFGASEPEPQASNLVAAWLDAVWERGVAGAESPVDCLAAYLTSKALAVCEGNLSRAAALLGLSRPTLRKRLADSAYLSLGDAVVGHPLACHLEQLLSLDTENADPGVLSPIELCECLMFKVLLERMPANQPAIAEYLGYHSTTVRRKLARYDLG